jgi:hypothetical protein
MNTYIRGLVALGSVVVLGLLTAGCYTQFGSVQDDRSEGAVGQEQYAYGDSTTVDDYEYARRQFYYDYYYPSAMIGLGFGWPWYGGHYSPYGYYSPWVDPWYGWCGSTYPGYYGYWGNPYWGYGSYYGHGGAYYPGGGGYIAAGSTPYGATRTFGSTRSSGSTRGTEVLPIGARSSTPVAKTGSGQLPPGRVSTGRRGQDGERQSVTGTRSGGQRPRSTAGNTSGRKESSRSEAPRWYPRPSVSEGSHVSPPVMAPQGGGSAGRESGRGGSERSGGGSTYSPPSSSPPPSGNSGGSASANTGSRGGNHR